MRAPVGPAETFCGLVVAFHERAARPLFARGIRGRIIDAPKLDRIHVELGRELVYRAFQRVDVGNHRWRSHEARRIAVCMDKRHACLDRAESIKPCTVFHTRYRIGVWSGGDFPSLVDEARDFPAALRADTNAVTGFCAIGLNGETLIACGNELDWPIEPFGRQSNKSGARRKLGLRPECTADEGTDRMNIGDVDTHLFRGIRLQPIHELAWLVDRQLIVTPDACRREQFDWIVVLGRRFVLGLKPNIGRGIGLLGVTGLRKSFIGCAFGDTARIKSSARRLGFVVHANHMSSFACRLEGIGDDQGDDLPTVLDQWTESLDRRSRPAAALGVLYVLQFAGVLVIEDLQYSGHCLGSPQVHRLDASFRNRAGHEERVGGI